MAESTPHGELTREDVAQIHQNGEHSPDELRALCTMGLAYLDLRARIERIATKVERTNGYLADTLRASLTAASQAGAPTRDSGPR